MKVVEIHLPLSKEMSKRMWRVEAFLKKTRQPASSVWMMTHALAALTDYFSCKEKGGCFYSMRIGVPVPISLHAVKEDMQGKVTHNVNLREVPDYLSEVLTELKSVTQEKDEASVALLGVGYLCELIDRIEKGDTLFVGCARCTAGCFDRYEPKILQSYRPVLLQ